MKNKKEGTFQFSTNNNLSENQIINTNLPMNKIIWEISLFLEIVYCLKCHTIYFIIMSLNLFF